MPTWQPIAGLEWAGVSESTTKSDDAEAPTQMWDERVYQVSHSLELLESFRKRFRRDPLDCMRNLLLAVWRKRIWISLKTYLHREYGVGWWEHPAAVRDLEVGRDCLFWATQATWWGWNLGSTPFFWRWPPSCRELIRDGHPPWFIKEPPQFLQPQRRDPDPEVAKNIAAKLDNVAQKGYIRPGDVKSLTKYFAVPKGEGDIRMVYDATISGLNDSLWAPTFVLPGTEAVVDQMDEMSWMGDLDMGEQFLNFPLHPDIQCYCGIDVRPYLGRGRIKTLWW
jgi:hypothetical protein